MKAGQLKEFVTVQQAATTSDVGPGKTVAWTTLAADLFAAVIPAGGAERLQVDGIRSYVSYRVTLRHRDDIEPKMRLIWGSRVLQIQTVVDPDGRRRTLELDCVEAL